MLLTANSTGDLSPYSGIASEILVIWKHTTNTSHKRFLIELFIVEIQFIIEVLGFGHLFLFPDLMVSSSYSVYKLLLNKL